MSFTRLTFVQSSENSGSGASTQATTPGVSIATGETIVVAVKWEASVGAATVTDTAGNTYTALTKVSLTANEFVQLFYCLSATSNASNIWTANLPAASTYRNIAVFRYSHTGTAAFVAQNTGIDNGASTAVTTAAFTAGDMAVFAACEFAGTTATPGSGWTEQADVATNGSHGFDRIDSPGGTIAGAATLATSAQWGAVGASFSDSGSAASSLIAAPPLRRFAPYRHF